jgi:Protein of unknown function (DUF3710)
VFRRRRREESADPAPIEDEARDGTDDRAAEDVPAAGSASGPWDEADDVPAAERIDFGSLQVPVGEGFEIQLNISDDQGPLIAIIHGGSSLQLQAFAAPKSGGLWDEVRQEISAAVAQAGGASEEAEGPFGAELHARVPGEPSLGQSGPQPIRFLGVDGPRWFLRGVLTGPAAVDPAAAAPLEEVFAGLVVVRGGHPVPPRDLLEIRLPEQARQAMEEQLAEQQGAPDERFAHLPNPFDRGPEITEIR